MLLTGEPDVEVVAEVPDGVDVLDAARRYRPDLVVLDGLDGGNLDVIRTVTGAGFAADPQRPVRVLVLTGDGSDLTVYRALRAGTAGLLLRDTAPNELLRAIRVVAAGLGWLDPAVTRQLIRDFAARSEPGVRTPAELRQLTNRERQVLTLAAQGFSNTEIAGRLFITEGTVKSHMGRVLMKLRLTNRAQAVAVAYQSGLVVVPPRR
ncbi:DNA-binding response regulator [Micromonospora echinofusca]|uniref:DNA-binding response regulator n=2 Tax=Micromonospora echinofusca TaxID=47858 RepID=A0ABS3VJ96_MICEH|nr:DNA-binding response regulator [Micromonospora echinofusca]